MSFILCLETSSKNCSVAIAKNGQVYNVKEELDDNYSHGQKLHVLIADLLLESNLSIDEGDAFCFSEGPGSYTGLRIGAAAVKGFAFVLKKPIITVSTLESMAKGYIMSVYSEVKSELYKHNHFCSVLDSRQGEVYAAIYNSNYTPLLLPSPCEINNLTSVILELLEKQKSNASDLENPYSIEIFGPGSYKLSDVFFTEHLDNDGEPFSDYIKFPDQKNIMPSAAYLCSFAQYKFTNNEFVDSAYFEPTYLKNFLPTRPKSSR